MSLPTRITQREYTKFVDPGDGQPAVRIASPTLYAVVNTGSVGNTNSLATLLSGPNQIGSVTISNVISLASINGQVLNVAGTNYIGLASVNIGGTLPALTAGTAFVGLASIQGNINLNAGTNFIGLVSTASINGNVLNVAGSNYIGLASVNIGGTLPALSTGANFIGLATVTVGAALPAGANFIGLISTASIQGNFQAVRAKTFEIKPIVTSGSSFATTTIPVGPLGAWYITSMSLSANASTVVNILSGPTYLNGNASIGWALSPLGGLALSGSVDTPIFKSLASGSAVVFSQSAGTAQLGGHFTYYTE